MVLADDIVLLNNSPRSLQSLLIIVEFLAYKWILHLILVSVSLLDINSLLSTIYPGESAKLGSSNCYSIMIRVVRLETHSNVVIY
jgi:hypothetical protein